MTDDEIMEELVRFTEIVCGLSILIHIQILYCGSAFFTPYIFRQRLIGLNFGI